jgi:hypothetical protein
VHGLRAAHVRACRARSKAGEPTQTSRTRCVVCLRASGRVYTQQVSAKYKLEGTKLSILTPWKSGKPAADDNSLVLNFPDLAAVCGIKLLLNIDGAEGPAKYEVLVEKSEAGGMPEWVSENADFTVREHDKVFSFFLDCEWASDGKQLTKLFPSPIADVEQITVTARIAPGAVGFEGVDVLQATDEFKHSALFVETKHRFTVNSFQLSLAQDAEKSITKSPVVILECSALKYKNKQQHGPNTIDSTHTALKGDVACFAYNRQIHHREPILETWGFSLTIDEEYNYWTYRCHSNQHLQAPLQHNLRARSLEYPFLILGCLFDCRSSRPARLCSLPQYKYSSTGRFCCGSSICRRVFSHPCFRCWPKSRTT